ncbi:hypothetical protein NM208_g4836 [Fusarium decemcellulare]|uniref:Uncharacterized protein n=1 Tax=Fusarium decemcellulare TaxID=57161 RepID=A0ACC1SJC2_9HYPO|nr:hypothetical protein NM208_g4836 [Fusarium decemcellulare]
MSIQESADATYMGRLSRLVHSKGQLESHGYTLAQLNTTQLDKKRRYVKGSSPCQQRNYHEPRRYAANELSKLWKYYKTPEQGHNDTRKVVVIDCEMAADAELIKLSLVDFVTGEILINKLVWPDVKVTNWNTPHSGVTGKEMYKARKDKTCIFGRKKAREEIWRFVGPKTIVVGHATNNDLSALRWIHPRVIDTQIVESNAVDEPHGLSLKSLVLEHLGKAIQPRGKGHDCLEDAMATRDLLHCQVLRASKPQKAWVPVI